MYNRLFLGFVLAVAVLLTACQQRTLTQATTPEATPVAADAQQFGAPITAKGAIKYDELLNRIEGQDSLRVKVAGTVEKVCQKKGCWMTIVSTNAQDPTMMVKFKDYGFFMPLDISGRKVIMDGVAFYQVTPVDELKHYAEDAGKTKAEIDAITEPKRELSFVADGVLVLN